MALHALDCVLKLEKTNHLYEVPVTESKALNKTILDTKKMVSNLHGKLEVYKSLDQVGLDTKKGLKK